VSERIAIVSSPRSGNTWLRWLLRDSLELQEIALHNYVDLTSIPDRCVVQCHWYREPNFQRFLANNRFRVVVLARHPLDIFISVLHFIRHEPETKNWLGGNCAIPAALVGQSPDSDDFLAYCLSFGAENLLSVTYQWWHDEQAIKVRYEELTDDTEEQLRRLARVLGYSNSSFTEAIRRHQLESFRALPNRHGWQGQPNLWRELIPSEHAKLIYERHKRTFQTLGYPFDPATVSFEQGKQRWEALLT
jgi:hypothetical protein